MPAEYMLADVQPPICAIPSREAFEGLSEEDRTYAHFMCRAAFLGARIVLRQTSAEAESIFDLLISIYKSVDGNWEMLFAGGVVSREDLSLFLDFAAMFFANLGNYRVAEKIYSTIPSCLGYPDDDGAASGYYPGSSRITKEEISAIQHAMQNHNMLPENTRVLKETESFGGSSSEEPYTLLLASSISSPSPRVDNINLDLPGGPRLKVQAGDYSSVLGALVAELESARVHTAEPVRKEMINHLIEAFSTGNHFKFKEAQKAWVRDNNPKVEAIMGFIETYQDPHGIRGAWEGIVAVVNKTQSQKFSMLVEHAPQFITKLPWNGSNVGLPINQKSEFETASFIKPEFTSLDTIGFAKPEIPAGINLPNFEDICQNLGSKNLVFGNVNNANPIDDEIPFIQPHEVPFIRSLRELSFEVILACHELLGHGSGQLFVESEPGKFNFDIENRPFNPLTQLPISSWYKPGQTWNNMFGADANAIEECRADGVALILITHKPVLEIFGYTDTSDVLADDIMYAGWLHYVYGAVNGLKSWNPQTRKWGQSHHRGQFALLRCMMQADASFLRIEISKGDLTIFMDRSKILTHALPWIRDYLLHLQVYKSTADVVKGVQYFNHFSEVDEMFQRCREIVIQKVPARVQYVQANTFLTDGHVRLQEYPPTREGLIQSWAEKQV